MSWEQILDDTPALIVVVPLIGGALALFMGRGIKPWLWALGVTITVFALCIHLATSVGPAGSVDYPMGSWPPPWGIQYRPDLLSCFVLVVVSGIAVVATLYARRSVEREIPGDKLRFFYSLWILSLTGLLGIAITGDAFNVYVLLEISSLTLYGLIALGKDQDRRALSAAFNYLILGSIGATFILLGIGYLYMVTGTLNMVDMSERLSKIPNSTTVHAAFAFLMVGLSLKMALFPLHLWQPNAYTYAPSAVSAFVAATATKVGVYMAIRFEFTIFRDESYELLKTFNSLVLMLCASLGIIVGAVKAIKQTNIKRMLAYSSVSQIGYIVVGFSLANIPSVQGAVVHVLNHAVTKGGLFMAIGIVVYRLGGSTVDHLRGLGRRMPLTAAAFTLGGLGLIGVPGTAGFISKWYLVQGAIQDGQWTLAVLILIGSMLAVIYVWRVVEIMYLQEPDPNVELQPGGTPWTMLVATWILIGSSIYFGVNAFETADFAGEAAQQLVAERSSS